MSLSTHANVNPHRKGSSWKSSSSLAKSTQCKSTTMLTIVLVYHLFLHLRLSSKDHFPLSWRMYFKDTFSLGTLVVHSQFLSLDVFISLSRMKDDFTEYIILDWKLFCLKNWSYNYIDFGFHGCCWEIRLPFLLSLFCRDLNSLTALKIFSLTLVFCGCCSQFCTTFHLSFLPWYASCIHRCKFFTTFEIGPLPSISMLLLFSSLYFLFLRFLF